MLHRDALAAPFDPADGIDVNAGATHPPAAWVDGLKPGGRLILPLTADEGWRSFDPAQIARPRRRVPDRARPRGMRSKVARNVQGTRLPGRQSHAQVRGFDSRGFLLLLLLRRGVVIVIRVNYATAAPAEHQEQENGED